MRILVAEDDCVSRRVLENLLQKWGHEVVLACDGNEAWDILQKPDAPSMVILDWMMPGIDGVDVCRILREIKQEIRPYVILLTGKDQKKDVVNGISSGADDYLTKPFDSKELRVRILAGERILNLQFESRAVKEALRKQASHDFLTGLPNRATITDLLQREFDRTSRTGDPFSVIMIDVDNFKSINDNHGHSSGDMVLSEIAKRMALTMRSYEYVGRYGGEEFMAVLSNCDLDGAMVMAERLRKVVHAEDFELHSGTIPVTASFGVACSKQLLSPSLELLIEMADTALYRSKLSGRNKVSAMEIASESPASSG